MDTFTLGQITEIIGAKSRRVAQVWAEAGVIQAEGVTERRGTGTHRRFSRDEAIIACFVHTFSLRQTAIGELKRISQVIRESLANPEVKRDLEIAINGDRPSQTVHLVLEVSGVGNAFCYTFRLDGREEDREDQEDRVLLHVAQSRKRAAGSPSTASIIIDAGVCLEALRGR